MVSVMNEVASSSRLSDTTTPSEVCGIGWGEVTLKRASGSGLTTVDEIDEDEDRSLLLFSILVRFIANSLIRSCRSRETSPATNGPGVMAGGEPLCAGVSSLGEGAPLLPFVISGVGLGYLREGGDPAGVRSGEGEGRWEDEAKVQELEDVVDGEGEVGGREGVRSDPSPDPLVFRSIRLDRCLGLS